MNTGYIYVPETTSDRFSDNSFYTYKHKTEWKILYTAVSDGKLYKSQLFQLFCSTSKTLSATSTVCFTHM